MLKINRNSLKNSFKITKSDLKKHLLNIITWMLVSIFFYFIIEVIHSGFSGLKSLYLYLQLNGFSFYINLNIILIFTSPALLFNRVAFISTLLGTIATLPALASRILLEIRGTPLIWGDFSLIDEAITTVGLYLSTNVILTIIAAVVLIAGILFLLWFVRFKNTKISTTIRALTLSIFVLILISSPVTRTIDVSTAVGKSTMELYQKNGFPRTFLETYLMSDAEEHNGYTKEKIVEIYNQLPTYSYDNLSSVEYPNIILVQLESVVDPYTFENLTFSEDPIPNLRAEFSRNDVAYGSFIIPSPPNTARTEFSVLTNSIQDYMPVGYTPYKNEVLKLDTVDNIVFSLKDIGYEATAIHNYHGEYYDRDLAYSAFGFDRYIPIETMEFMKFVSVMASDDRLLLRSLDETLSKSDGSDFVFAVTMEAHSPYSSDPKKGKNIDVSGNLTDEELTEFEHYAKQLSDTDLVLSELINYVREHDEHTILVMYGDHYPHSLNKNSLSDEQLHTTFYYAMDNKSSLNGAFPEQIDTHELTTHILSHYGIAGGILNQYQLHCSDNDDYEENYELLQYDMVFGNNYLEEIHINRDRSDLKFGIFDLEISGYELSDDKIIVNGIGFNKYTEIFLDGKIVETTFHDDTKISASLSDNNISEICVKQVGVEGGFAFDESKTIYIE